MPMNARKNESLKIKKEVMGVPSPPITLVAVKIFQNFSPLSVDRILKRGKGGDNHDYQLTGLAT